jgi:glyoxylase-like metal-dependent hydrolase (beta-lactamase superfamily II)
MGAGGNIAVLTGRDGKLLIDAGFAGARPKITGALTSISSDPTKHLINTHWHFDHTDGNEWLHSAGAAILAQTNTRKHLSTTTRVEGWNFTFAPSPAGAIPTDVFDDERILKLNGTTIALKHYAPAHTDSDISVHFTDADIFHVADTFWNGYYPFIDYSTGGSIDGMIRATEANLARVTDTVIVIPGHGAVADKSQLAFYRDLLIDTREKVAALKKQGKTLGEIVAAKPTAATDAKWGNGFRSPRDFIGDFFQDPSAIRTRTGSLRHSTLNSLRRSKPLFPGMLMSRARHPTVFSEAVPAPAEDRGLLQRPPRGTHRKAAPSSHAGQLRSHRR